MPFPSVTYTFANSTTADATQVNQNFTDLVNGISDGTKNINISALTAAGTTLLNGNVTLGASSSNTLTLNAVISSSMAFGTTFTYDIGSSTVGAKSLYLASNDSTAHSVRLIAGAVGTSYTFTLPTSGGTSQQGLITDGSGTTSWGLPRLAANAQSLGSGANYTLTSTDTTVNNTTSTNSVTNTLPTAVGISGKRYTINKVDSGSGIVTLLTTSSQTIGGIASNVIILGTLNDSITVESDGSNWQIVSWKITLAARYTGIGSGNIGTTDTLTVYKTKDFDPWSAVSTNGTSTWTFTAPIAGKYLVQATQRGASVTSSGTNNNWYIQVYVNGSAKALVSEQIFPAAVSGTVSTNSGGAVVNVPSGQTIAIYATRSTNITAFTQQDSATTAHVTITYLGN